MSWNVDAAVTHVINNAAPTPMKQCGAYVRAAINAGGLNVVAAGWAGNYGDNLTNQGFELIESCPEKSGDTPFTTQFRKGDVVI